MENLRIEYKRTLSREVLKGLGSDVAAYANTKGGEIWFGVDDKGRPIGSSLTEIDRQSVAQKAANCHPPIAIDFEERQYEGHQIIAVLIPESSSIHADDRHRFPVRIGGIKHYLDAAGILLLARARALEFAPPASGTEWNPPANKTEREDLPPEVAQHFLNALQSDNKIIRTEALKDLEATLHRFRIEHHAAIMDALVGLGGRIADAADGRPLDLLRYILLQASAEDRAQWRSKVREKAVSICRSAESVFGVLQALNLLGEFTEAEDVELIVWIISSWPPDLYTHARPLQWLHGLKSQGHLFLVQQALFKGIESAQDAQIVERIKECLESVRRS